MVQTTTSRSAPGTEPDPPPAQTHSWTDSINTTALLFKIFGIGLTLAIAVALTPSLLSEDRWTFLVVVWLLTALILLTYGTRRAIPAKYLLPGTTLLFLFVIYPVIATAQASTTNLGDGTRGTKQQTVDQILATSVIQAPNTPRYNLSVATSGSPAEGPFTLFLVDQSSGAVFKGDSDGVHPVAAGAATVTNKVVTAVPGQQILSPVQVNAANDEITKLVVPTENGQIRTLGIRQAYDSTTTLKYDPNTDTITNTSTSGPAAGATYTVAKQGDREYFVDETGERLSDQSWKSNVGLDNFKRAFTDSRISSDFMKIFAWTVSFATISVGSTFLLGLFLAVTLNDPRVRGQRYYRSILLLPYAIPGFIALLIWSGFFNTDFGLINDLTGLTVNWFGNSWTAKFAVLLTNLWMGFPYMFLVATGALQAIPGDLKEAASIDGASGFMGFRKITFPLLLVTVAPLLVASFAFNFNNYNAIALLTEGGPFSPANPTAGGTDILISYTIRLAFGAGGAQLGFASAISVLLFILTGVIAALQFRLTRGLEDVN